MDIKCRFFLLVMMLVSFSCSQEKDAGSLIRKGNQSLIIHNTDSVILGVNTLKKDLFKGLGIEFFPKNQYQEGGPPRPIDVYNEFEGIYINQKLFDCFEKRNGHTIKISNTFDVVYIYPEESRYNFFFNQKTNYRVFHYLGCLYQTASPQQNLPYYVQSIFQKDNNCLLFTYKDRSSFVDQGVDLGKVDSITFSTFPEIKIDFSNSNLKLWQRSNRYIKLSEDILKDMNLKISYLSSPQDITELYIREIVTKIVNLKNNTNDNLEEEDIAGSQEVNSTGFN